MKPSKQFYFSSVQLVAQSCLTLCGPMDCSTPGLLSITNSQSLPKLMSIDATQPSHSLSSSSSPAFHLSQHQSLYQLASFSFSISPSNENSGLIPFRMDWLDLLAVQGTLKSLLQHHSSKPSILWCSAFFIFQLSHP